MYSNAAWILRNAANILPLQNERSKVLQLDRAKAVEMTMCALHDVYHDARYTIRGEWIPFGSSKAPSFRLKLRPSLEPIGGTRRGKAHRCSVPVRPGNRHRLTAAAYLPTEISSLAFAVPPACFDASCQQTKDLLFVASLLGPLISFSLAAAIFLRSREDVPDEYDIFEDKETGNVYVAPEGLEPARDKRGELAYRLYSYTPFPADASGDEEEVRVPVGPVDNTQPRTFLFPKIWKSSSQLVTVRLPRPLGIIFEEEASTGRAVIAEIMDGSNAQQLCRKAALDSSLGNAAPKKGDVLRAITCTNVVYQAGALFSRSRYSHILQAIRCDK